MNQFFKAETAIIDNGSEIGEGTKVWHFAHVMEGTKIGMNCVIGERVFIGRKVIIGNNVHIANGANIYEGSIIKDDVFIGNNVSFTNVRYPRAWRKAREFVPIIIDERATINANAVITAGVHVGKNSTVGDGAIVLGNVSEGGLVVSPKAECVCDRDECSECKVKKEKAAKRNMRYARRRELARN